MKQIGAAYIQYALDYDEKLVPAYKGNSTSTSIANANNYWYTTLQPYVKSTQVFQCPSARPHPGSSYTTFFVGNYPGYKAIPPMSNMGWKDWTKIISLSQAARTSESIIVMEFSYQDIPKSGSVEVLSLFSADDYYNNIANYPWATNYPGRHMGGHNVLYVDGHAKWKSIAGFRGRDSVLNEYPESSWQGW